MAILDIQIYMWKYDMLVFAVFYCTSDIIDIVIVYKKAQLTQELRATAVHVWRPLMVEN